MAKPSNRFQGTYRTNVLFLLGDWQVFQISRSGNCRIHFYRWSSSEARSHLGKAWNSFIQKITVEHPKANGLAENMLRKVANTAIVDHKDPKEEVHKYLMHFRATPHSATDKSPAEMLFGHPLQMCMHPYFWLQPTVKFCIVKSNTGTFCWNTW